MNFSEHIDKGVWTVADKALTVLFGLYFMKLSITHLPVEEYGLFTIIYQAVFLIIVNFGASFALQPMMKFSAETDEYRSIMSAGLLMNATFMIVSVSLVLIAEPLLISWFSTGQKDAESLSRLIMMLPLLTVSFFVRNYVLYILQAKYDLIRLLLIDVIYFASAIGLMHYMIAQNELKNAADLLLINVYAYALSSLAALVITLKYWKLRFTGLATEIKRLYDFGKFSLMSSAANNIFEQTDNYMIITLLSPRELGIYAVAKTFLRVFQIFSQIIQSLLVPVLSRQFARDARDTVRIICEKAVCFSTVALMPVFVLYLFFAGTILSFMTDKPDFYDSAVMIQWSSLLVFLVPWNSVLGCVYVAANRMKTAFYINSIAILLNLTLSGLFIVLIGTKGVIVSIICVNLIVTMISMIVLKNAQLLDCSVKKVYLRIRDIRLFILNRGFGIEK